MRLLTTRILNKAKQTCGKQGLTLLKKGHLTLKTQALPVSEYGHAFAFPAYRLAYAIALCTTCISCKL